MQLIQVSVNGQPFQLPTGSSITALLALLNLPCDRVAVELNKTLVRKRDWNETRIPAESQLEVVEFVGGG